NVVALVGAVIVTTGGVVSTNVLVTVNVSVEVLPAASRAVTVMTLAPLTRATLATLHAVVPVAVPLPPAALLHVTCVTPTASEAVPPSATVAVLVEKVSAAVGAPMVTTGA